MSNRLRSKIRARNLANHTANTIEPLLLGALESWIGRQIVKRGGTLTERAHATFDPLKETIQAASRKSEGGWNEKIEIYFRGHYHSLAVAVRANVWHDSEPVSSYQETSINLGVLGEGDDGTKLIQAGQPISSPRRTDYNIEEILALRRELTAARDVVHRLENQLCNFGEYDN